jgi:ABC-2 type transport system permease protein
MNHVGIVAGREFFATVRRKSYVIVTFGMPFFALLYIGLFAVLPAISMAGSRAQKEIGLVDEAGVVRAAELEDIGAAEALVPEAVQALSQRTGDEGAGRNMASAILDQATSPIRFRLYRSREVAMVALRTGVINRFYLVPEGYLASGAVESYQTDEVSFDLRKTRSRARLGRLLSRSLVQGLVPEELRPRVERPIVDGTSTSFVLNSEGSVEPLDQRAALARVAIPVVFGGLLLMALMISSGYLLQGVAEEKENRVIEVILSSVRPDQLLLGKLLGLGAAGLLQLVVWVSIVSLATSLVAAAVLALLDLWLFLACFAFFILGFLMIGSLMTGTGALGTTSRESQQIASLWSILAVLPPALLGLPILDDPNGWVARLVGWFPLSAPITMMLRLGTGKVPLWDVLVAILFLVLGVYLGIRVAGALFRLGLLMYGKRPSVREILRQLRGSPNTG